VLAGDGLVVACGEGALVLLRVQRAGRAAMSGPEFLRGRKIAPGTVLA
jgi:methionyl-tRNA formyltransferase